MKLAKSDFRLLVFPVLIFISLFSTTPQTIAQPGCVGPSGVSGVAIDLIRDGQGVPIIETTDKLRRERVEITAGLRDALGITVPTDLDDETRPQIRVIVETTTLNSGLRSTANFTVQDVIDGDTSHRVEIYDADPSEGAVDEDSGLFKVFETTAFDATATLTVHAVAASRTEVDDHEVVTITQNFCEPTENHDAITTTTYGTFENVAIRNQRDFVLLVPHGGMIEEETSTHIPEIKAAFTARGHGTNVWEAASFWDSDLVSERFHITSKAIDPQGFPGLDQLLDAGTYDAGNSIEFQHAASLHGFGPYDGHALVFGGRAEFEAKCYVAHQIQQQLTDDGLGAIAFYVYGPDGEAANALNLPDEHNDLITKQRPDVGLTGRSCENLINRLTQNEDCSLGHGGFQIEESSDLREDAAVRNAVSKGIANGFADLIEDPTLIDTTATTYCDALVGTATDGHGQIGDTVWVDLNDSGVQDPGELGREGVTVELVESGAVVATTTTNALGRYVFGSLDAATYTVRFVAPTGFHFSLPSQGGDGSKDSDVIAGGETGDIVLDAGETRLDIDAGLVPDGTAGEIGDFTWLDEDGNGVFDGGEVGLADVLVELETALGTPVASTTSGTFGNYRFTGLLPGDYVVRFTATGYLATTGSTTTPFSLAADAIDNSRDAGFKSACEDYPLVAFGSPWAYPGTTGSWSSLWNQDTFDDSTWFSGSGLLGFSTSRTVNTTVPNGASIQTYYFRHTFEVDDASLVQALDLELERDDGAVVYLNGQEVFRSNLPEGVIDASTRALSNSWERVTASVDVGQLRSGSNLLAVEIHQRTAGATKDFAFDLELRASSCNPCHIGTLELFPSADTYLREEDPDDDKGDKDNLYADGGTGEGRSMLFAWDLSQAPTNVTVLGAELQLEVIDDTSAFYPVYALATGWSENDATWNSSDDGVLWQAAGAQGASDRDNVELGVAHSRTTGAYTLSLNAAGRQQVDDWLSGASTHYGLIVAAGSNTNGIEVSSREGTHRPVLRVVYSQTCQP